jgi:hypothetical protein
MHCKTTHEVSSSENRGLIRAAHEPLLILLHATIAILKRKSPGAAELLCRFEQAFPGELANDDLLSSSLAHFRREILPYGLTLRCRFERDQAFYRLAGLDGALRKTERVRTRLRRRASA